MKDQDSAKCRVQYSVSLMMGKFLILRALHIILGVIEYLGPVIPLINDLLSEEVASQMIPTITTMDFLHLSEHHLVRGTSNRGRHES